MVPHRGGPFHCFYSDFLTRDNIKYIDNFNPSFGFRKVTNLAQSRQRCRVLAYAFRIEREERLRV
jgi:hypothetical protein